MRKIFVIVWGLVALTTSAHADVVTSLPPGRATIEWSKMLPIVEAFARHQREGFSPSQMKLVEELKKLPTSAAKARRVHQFFLKYRYERYSGISWRSPAEFERVGGICRDFALAKYLVLRAAGLSDTHMRVVQMNPLGAGESHAVLLVESEEGLLVLADELPQPQPFSYFSRWKVFGSFVEGKYIFHGM